MSIEGETKQPGLDELKERLDRIMRRPKITARDAEEAGEAARALADLLRGEERALRLLRGDDSSRGERAHVGSSVAALPLHEAAERVLQDGGWPMHVRDLGARIKARGWRHPRATKADPHQIEFQLAARLPRHPETFKKFGPNTFGLASWGDDPPRPQRPALGFPVFNAEDQHPGASELHEHDAEIYEDQRNAPWGQDP